MNSSKNKLRLIIIILLTVLSTSCISVYSTYNYLAKDIKYQKTDGNEITLEHALNELYEKSNSIVDFSNAKLLYSKNNGLSFSGNYTFDGEHKKAILFLWGASRDNNVKLEYSISNVNIVYDNILSTYYDTYTKGRIIIIDNITEGTYLSFFLQCQPGIFIYGI